MHNGTGDKMDSKFKLNVMVLFSEEEVNSLIDELDKLFDEEKLSSEEYSNLETLKYHLREPDNIEAFESKFTY
jgi:hypothetical protein